VTLAIFAAGLALQTTIIVCGAWWVSQSEKRALRAFWERATKGIDKKET
jgi:hypothetical protein